MVVRIAGWSRRALNGVARRGIPDGMPRRNCFALCRLRVRGIFSLSMRPFPDFRIMIGALVLIPALSYFLLPTDVVRKRGRAPVTVTPAHA